MNIIRTEKSITIYPTVADGINKNYGLQEATVIKNMGKKANILHRKYNGKSWDMVKMQMDKEQLQVYIDELQKVCEELNG